MIRKKVEIDAMQSGFVQGTGTTHAMFIVPQLLEKFLG